MAIGSTQPFRPAGTVSLNAGTSPTSVPLAGGGDSVLVTNATASLAFVRFGTDASVTATPADLPVLPNARALIGINALITAASALLLTGSGGVFFTRGDGSTI